MSIASWTPNAADVIACRAEVELASRCSADFWHFLNGREFVCNKVSIVVTGSIDVGAEVSVEAVVEATVLGASVVDDVQVRNQVRRRISARLPKLAAFCNNEIGCTILYTERPGLNVRQILIILYLPSFKMCLRIFIPSRCSSLA